MNISFIIITNGSKPEELLLQLDSIYKQKIENFEIVICGDIKGVNIPEENTRYIESKEDASLGCLGGMRNKACAASKFDNLVISDDDMFFCSDWYQNLLLHKDNFDILTPLVKLADGTRFWDKCCYQSPTHGHSILEPNEEDEYLYMSGGQSWVMKKHVWSKIKWDETLSIYAMKNLSDYKKGKDNEDTDFAKRCRDYGFSIAHDENIKVMHNDPSYTSLGRLVRRRLHPDQNWCANLNFPHKVNMEIAKVLLSFGIEAEAADMLRKSSADGDISAELMLSQIEDARGGKLSNTNFCFSHE